MINLCTVITIQQYSKWNFLKLSANSAFSFLGIGPQTKTRNWRKIKFEWFLTGESLWKGIRVSLRINLRLYYQRRKVIMIFRGFRRFREFRGIDLAVLKPPNILLWLTFRIGVRIYLKPVLLPRHYLQKIAIFCV